MLSQARPITDFVQCDGSGEDPGCQDRVAAKELNWGDHNYYMQHYMWCCSARGNGTAPGQPGCAFAF